MSKTKKSGGVLFILSGDETIEKIALENEITVIGREDGDVLLEDGEISSTHCQIQRIGGFYHLFDLNSTNGTYLNGLQIVKSKLSHNDRIKVGSIELKFETTASGADHTETVALGPSLQTDSEADMFSGFNALLCTPFVGIPDPQAVKISEALQKELDRLRTPKPFLFVTYADGSEETLSLKNKQLLIGRVGSVGQFEKDEEMSRKHAIISIDNEDRFTVEDLGSTNGTFVNDKKIDGSKTLKENDIVRIGSSKIRCKMLAEA